MRRLVFVSALAVIIGAAVMTVSAQRRWYGGSVDVAIDKPPAYDGRFTFARLKFTTGPGGYYFGGLPAWAHGYVPIRGETIRSETAFVKILNAVTNMKPHLDGTAVVDVGSPELFNYPVVYVTEAGFMDLSDKDVINLREYIQKGGFLIFDDFRDPYDGPNFRVTMERVLPGEHLMELAVSHPIFHSFFEIATLNFVQAYDRGGAARFQGMFEHNDPTKPLQMIVNYNNDVSQYWQWSDSGYAPIDLSNEAYKLGVNYVLYSMTH